MIFSKKYKDKKNGRKSDEKEGKKRVRKK